MLRGYLHGAWAKEHFSDIEYYRGLDEVGKVEYVAAWSRGRILRERMKENREG